jgi:hypothetical protein
MIQTLEISYSESCLPKTITQARIQSARMWLESDPKFLKLPKEWEFDDKVLAFLAPCFEGDINNYYLANSDKQMSELFSKNQLKLIDEALLKLLKEYLALAKKMRIYSHLKKCH